MCSLHRLSMIEPGPVHTEFETKMMENVAKMEYPGADPDTVRYFKDVYLPSSIDIFEAMGQTPEDIAKVSKKQNKLKKKKQSYVELSESASCYDQHFVQTLIQAT